MFQKRKILFVTYGGGHVNMIIPIVQELETRSGYQIYVLGLTTAREVLARAGISSFGFRHIIRDADEYALEWGQRLEKDVNNNSNAVPYEETVAYLGLSYVDLEVRCGTEDAARLYVEKGRQAFLPLTVMERLFAELEPDLVVATNSPRAERAAIMTAGALRIPSVCLVDLFALHEIGWIGQKGYADKVCVLSEFVKKSMLIAGREFHEVIVTGNPAFDRLAATDLSERGEKLRANRRWGRDRVILWISQPEPARHPFTGEMGDVTLPRRVDQCLFMLLERHLDWRLVIRPHPSENVQFTCLPERVEVSPASEELAVLLKAVDIVLVMSSTVGLEAALLGTPVVALRMSVFTPDAPYVETGIAQGVDRLSDLEGVLCQAFDGRARPRLDLPKIGGATDNVIKVLDEVMGSVS